jgi:hypothetical protein
MPLPKVLAWHKKRDRKPKFKIRPKLPNPGSLHQTPASLILDVHYAKLLLVERWTWDRFIRFAAYLKMTPYELGSAALISHDMVDHLRSKNHLGGYRHQGVRAQALILTLLEAHLCGAIFHDVIQNPFPDLNKVT